MFNADQVVYVKRLEKENPLWKFGGACGVVIEVLSALHRKKADRLYGLADRITVLFKEFDGNNDVTQKFDEFEVSCDRRSGETPKSAKKYAARRKLTWFDMVKRNIK